MIIPFFIPHAGCPHQCVFCDQKSITGNRSLPDPLAIPSTIESHLKTSSPDGPIQVAFYGGSFTALPVCDQEQYLGAVQPFLDNRTIRSIRLSTRPDAIDRDILAHLKQYRVTTVELGAQSMDDDVLLLSGRGHTAAQTACAVELLREHGFQIGIQLMPGLPGDTSARFQETVAKIIELSPNFVRLYPALVIKDTPLAELYRNGKYTPLPLEKAVVWCQDAVDRFTAAGIEVTRIGLQSTEELERPGTVIAGPWHPAFRQLVDSARLLGSMRTLLVSSRSSSSITFAVNPTDLSTAIGQNRCNINAIRNDFGSDPTIITDPALPRGAVKLVSLQ